MEKCILCGKELVQYNGDHGEFCKTCQEFFELKYKDKMKEELARFKKDVKKEVNRSIKLKRRKK